MATMDFGRSRSWVVRIVIIVVICIFIARLLWMQVIDNSYKELAENRGYRKKSVIPSRGQLFDRNNKIVVSNEPSYEIWVSPAKVKGIDTAKLCEVMGIDSVFFNQKMKEARQYSPVKESRFLSQLSIQDFARIQEFLYEFQGFSYRVLTVRKYPNATGAQLLGYVTEVDTADIRKSKKYYQQGEYIGKTGIEKSYEKILRGVKGYKHVVIDNFGREVGRLGEGQDDIAAIAGKDIILGLDIELQNYAELLLHNKKGAVVAIEPSTGEILCLVSSPTYDPNLLVGNIRNKNFAALQLDPLHPLTNRALTGYYPPGSQFKAIMALVGLQSGTLTPTTGYTCGGGYHMSGHTVGCHSHPSAANVAFALQVSCNTYFCNVLKHFIDDPEGQTASQGLAKLDVMLASFGVGVKTGLDLPGEKPGNVPDPEDYDKIYGKGRWKSSNFITVGIGQDQIIVTPLQNANIMACIANRGFWYTPHVVKYISGEDSLMNIFKEKHITLVDAIHFEPVIEGLSDVVKAGTARIAKIDSIEICGKTGTAQNPFGKHHSEFSAFAPRENPKIAIAVLVENAGQGARFSAPIASLLIEFYINRKIADSRKDLEKRMLEADLINLPKVDGIVIEKATNITQEPD